MEVSLSRFPTEFFWNAFCFASIFGIWPRYIEPALLKTTKLKCDLSIASPFKMLQISDLHFNKHSKKRFLKKILKHVQEESPDVIVFTGDFLCNGSLNQPQDLKNFLMSFRAPCGLFAVLGNHDYASGLNINAAGEYDVVSASASPIQSGIMRLWNPPKLTGTLNERAINARPHPQLIEILQESNIELLNNRTVQINNQINLTGLGEHMAGDVNPQKAFEGFDRLLPGVVLLHNPDASIKLNNYPGDLILSGHTHGGQVNLPWIWKRFTSMENPTFKAGLYRLQDKNLFISRGVGCSVPFRFNAVPEIVSIHFERSK